MPRTLRTRLLLGTAPLPVITVGVGAWAVVMFLGLGGDIDVILRENYRSVLAAQNMKEALERMDSAVLFALGGRDGKARSQLAEYRPVFEKNLAIELGNVTLEGEGELASEMKSLYERYLSLADRCFALGPGEAGGRDELYFAEILPTFQKIKDRADDILNINQRNMEEMDRRARASAKSAARGMAAAVLGAAVLGTLIALALSRSILAPVAAVTKAAEAMARDEIDQAVPVLSRDELGRLAESFNTMASRIREFRQAGTAKLIRAQKTAQATIDSFPDPVVVVDPDGAVERANRAARLLLGAAPTEGAPVRWEPPGRLRPTLAGVLRGEPDHLPTGFEHAVAIRDQDGEHFFLPRILSIRDESAGTLGAAVVLTDVTRFRLLDQLKSDMVATASHELKTPLTGLQMVVHLLLEETVGPLNSKQTELLQAARQDSDRLLATINNLLDLTKIEQGRLRLDLRSVPAAELVAEAADRFRARAEERGVSLEVEAAPDAADAETDRERIKHVFDNLVGNALTYTPRGGRIRLLARPGPDGYTRFSVSDTGPGIPPEHLPRLFERFYRVPGRSASGGAGLGLAIAREIVEAHGGRISAENGVGGGATFTFSLKAADAGRGDAERRAT